MGLSRKERRLAVKVTAARYQVAVKERVCTIEPGRTKKANNKNSKQTYRHKQPSFP